MEINKYKILDTDGSELSIEDLIEKYFFNRNYYTSCAVIFTKLHNNSIEQYSMVEEEQTKDNEEEEEKKSEELESSADKISNPTDTTTIESNYSTYRYTPKQIEEFFASDNGQEEEHTLEESICKPLIGQQNYKPFLLYCKICHKVEFQSLISMENHIRLKDLEKHKAKLL